MEKNLVYSYDKERDILYVSVGKPQDSIGDEISDDVFALFDPRTKKIIGFTIINFEKHFTKTKNEKCPSFNVPVKADFEIASSRA